MAEFIGIIAQLAIIVGIIIYIGTLSEQSKLHTLSIILIVGGACLSLGIILGTYR